MDSGLLSGGRGWGAACALGLLLALAAGAGPATAQESALTCRVIYETADGLYVDVGTESGIQEGATGWLYAGPVRVARVEVGKVSGDSAFLKVLSDRTAPLPEAGTEVSLVLGGSGAVEPAPASPTGPRAPSPTLKEDRTGDEEFVPLLAQPDLGSRAFTEASNVFQGSVTLRETFQIATEDQDLDYSLTRLSSSATVERLGASPWALEWNAALSYRGGRGFRDTRDYQNLRLEIHRLALFRRFDDRSMVRLGRFIPRELPSVGYLDGLHGELAIHPQFRVGAMLGFKPSRDRLDIDLDEFAFAGYGTVELGERGDLHYLGTIGLLSTLWEGTPDRLAILLDQTADLGDLSLASSSEVDFEVGEADSRDSTRLTRWNLVASWRLADPFTLRAGVDKHEVPDTEAQREALNLGALDPDEFFEDDYWRFFGGFTWSLPGALSLGAEVSFVDSDFEDAVRWYVSVTRTGLGFGQDASLTLTVYNLEADEASGFGGRLSAYIPTFRRKLILQPGVTVRWVEHDTSGANFFDVVEERLAVVDVSMRARWLLSRSWTLFGGVSYARADDDNRVQVDLGVTWWW